MAAVNNNGTGVGGVAGGDGSPGSGVKMISCQTFQTISGAEKPTNNFPAAIVYGADNGAVISQNSWGSVNLEPLSEAEAAAIQYFIENAGIDKETGLQTGPMKGGIVIFAAGNLGNSGHYMPGAYESCFAVAAMGPAFRIASYSNYGSYVEITAPGGDKNYGTDGQVYSTLPGNLYGWLQGTSMACPHVSGIAALAISKYGVGSPGFTPVQLRELLLASANDIYPYNRNYSGQLGTGYIDAYKVLAGTGGAAPQPVSDLEAKWTFEGAYLSWSVTSDPDSGKASRYDILWSESNLDGIDFDDPPAGTRKTIVRVNDAAVGGKLATRLKGMESGKSYYISIAAVDYDGNRSAAYTVSGAPQSDNYPPEILGVPEEIILNTAEYREVPIEVLDMEGYDWTYSMTAGSSALNIRKDNGEGLTLVFDCIKALPGNYTATIGITDNRGDKAEAVIPYTIKPNNAPEATGVSEFVLHNVDEPGTFDLTRLFTDKDNDVLKYEVKLADMLFAEISYSESTLTAKALKIGTSRLTVTARDPRGLSAETAVMLVCRDAKRTADIYPVPVKKDGVLNIRMGKDVEGTIDVALFNTSGGGSVFEQTVAISPSAPATVNISSLRAGTYKIVVRYGETEISKTIAKL